MSSLGAVTQAADVSVHADVVQVVLRCLDLTLVTLSCVVQCKRFFLTKRCIVVKVDLRIKAHNCMKQESNVCINMHHFIYRFTFSIMANPGSPEKMDIKTETERFTFSIIINQYSKIPDVI